MLPFRKSNVHACGCFVFQSVLHHSFSPLYSLGIMKTKKEKRKIVSILITQRVLVGYHEEKEKKKRKQIMSILMLSNTLEVSMWVLEASAPQQFKGGTLLQFSQQKRISVLHIMCRLWTINDDFVYCWSRFMLYNLEMCII